MTTTTTPINTIVSANVRYYVGSTAPSTVADWLGIGTCTAISLLDGQESFTIEQLETLTRHTDASFLQLALSPGQLWAQTLRQALTEFETEGVGGDLAETLWAVLGEMTKRATGEAGHRANMLLTEALQVIITNQILDDDQCLTITSKIRAAIMILNAV